MPHEMISIYNATWNDILAIRHSSWKVRPVRHQTVIECLSGWCCIIDSESG